MGDNTRLTETASVQNKNIQKNEMAAGILENDNNCITQNDVKAHIMLRMFGHNVEVFYY